MSHGVKYFEWRAGRPRWVPGASLREKGAAPQALCDETGRYLPLWNAMLAAYALNQRYGVGGPPPRPPGNHSPERRQGSFLYFVLAGESVKIGYSTSFVGRAADAASSVPAPPTIAVVVPGSRKDEAALHKLFAPDRLQGEWFRATNKLLDFMARCVRARCVVLDKPKSHDVMRDHAKKRSRNSSVQDL